MEQSISSYIPDYVENEVAADEAEYLLLLYLTM